MSLNSDLTSKIFSLSNTCLSDSAICKLIFELVLESIDQIIIKVFFEKQENPRDSGKGLSDLKKLLSKKPKQDFNQMGMLSLL